MENFIHTLSLAVPGFLLSIVFHEWAHAYVAHRFGDDTAKQQGRLSLNPMVHYDLVGTIIFPLIGIMIGSVPFGWAKPVPVDPRRFKSMKHGIFWVSFAGPGANIILAIISAFLYAIVITQVSPSFGFHKMMEGMLRYSVLINVVLAVFNLIPFPPLDGSKMVSTFLDYEQARKYEQLQNYTFIFIILLWTTNIFSYLMTPAVYAAQGVMNLFINLLG